MEKANKIDGIRHAEVEQESPSHNASPMAEIGGFETDLDDLPPGYFKSKFFLGSFAAITLGLNAGVGAFGYAAPILGQINASIGPDPRYTWVALVYNASLAVCIAPLGRITDIFGRRWWFIGSGILSVIGSIICATATSIPILIGGNVFLGIGTAAQLSFHYVLGEIVPMKYRYLASAILYGTLIPTSGLAPLISYCFILRYPNVGWRGIYYVLLAINVLALLCWALFYYPPSFSKKHKHDEHNTKAYWIKHFDYVGLFLFAAGFVVFLLGLSWGGVVYPWNSAATITSIVLGFVIMMVFALWEIYAPLKEPLIPVHLYKNIEWVVAGLLMSLGASVYYGLAVVWPAQCAVLYADDHGLIYLGTISSIIGLSVIFGQVVGGVLANRIGHAKYQIMTVFGLATVFLGCGAVVQPDNFGACLAVVFLGVFFTGWNETICIANSTICIKDQREIGIGGGIAGSTRSGIVAVILAVYTTVLTNRLGETIPAQVPPAVINVGLPVSSVPGFIAALSVGNVTALQALPGISAEVIAAGSRAYKQANADAFRVVYLTTMAFSLLGCTITFFAPNTERYMSDKVAATVHMEDVSDGEKVVSG